MMHEIAQGVSLALTSTTIVVCSLVAWYWRGHFLKPSDDAAVYWFSLGVLVHFICSLFDNSYWGWVWSLKYAGYEQLSMIGFDYGAYPNILFRQIGTVFAGYCHLRAALIYSQSDHNHLNRILAWSLVVGFIYIYLIK